MHSRIQLNQIVKNIECNLYGDKSLEIFLLKCNVNLWTDSQNFPFVFYYQDFCNSKGGKMHKLAFQHILLLQEKRVIKNKSK